MTLKAMIVARRYGGVVKLRMKVLLPRSDSPDYNWEDVESIGTMVR